MTLDPVATEYLALSFAIERRFPGFVDAYFGPPEIKDQALAEPEPAPADLLARVQALQAAVAAAGYPASRAAFLTAQVRAMAMICRRLAGEAVDYRDEVRECFDIEPDETPEAVFAAAIAELDDLLPGAGDVRERMIAWRAGYVVAPETARELVDLILAETRRRTAAFVELADGDAVEIAFVSDKPWSGYNWYLGGGRSRVELNGDLPIHAHELTNLVAHEAYPGHHTEHALKERMLYRERGYGEHAIQLVNTPECVISEGIATLAESMIFPGDEGARWQAKTLYPAAGIAGDPAREARIAAARAALRAVRGNAALRFHAGGEPEEAVIAYIARWELRTEEQARQGFRFIADPLWRPYVFTYHVGRDLLGRWLDLAPAAERETRFRILLTEQMTPSQIAAEIANGPS